MSKVKEIHDSNLYGVVIETGCSTATSSKLMDIAGASKTIFYSLQPYSKVYEEQRYGSFPRSVSKEFINSVLDTESNVDSTNFVFASSWQLHSDSDPLQVPHGWFGLLDKKNNVKYFLHFTFNHRILKSYNDLIQGKHNPKVVYQETRDLLIDTIGHIGVNLIHTLIKGDITQFDLNDIPNNAYLSLDIAYCNDKLDIKLLMNVLEKFKGDYFLVFKDNQAIRLEDLMREDESFTIQKGSFNPIHHGHLEMMRYTMNKYKNSKPVFLSSTFRYDKDHLNVDDIIKKIQMINNIGYDHIICKSMYFYKTFDLLLNWTHNKNFKFPIGSDTINRIIATDMEYVNSKPTFPKITLIGYINRIISKYRINFKFIIFPRKGYEITKEIALYKGIIEINTEYKDDGISSTYIRNNQKIETNK